MSAEFLRTHKRTQLCGTYSDAQVGQKVVAYGWVQSYRDHGGVIFVDLRDRSGLVQLRFEPSHSDGTAHTLADRLRSEWVIGVVGEVISRGTNINPKIPTGAVEILCDELIVLSEAKTPPFEIKDDLDTNELTRLTYRYLDLRRPKLAANLALRSRVNQLTRGYFCDNHGFLELETPILAKSTPEGARDYLVPSRVHPGEFYALPQSPQQFKQLFMMSGMDRYMQICRCFRDEDLRADRQPEFTQLDLELSFVDVDDIRAMLDGYVEMIWREVMGTTVKLPIPTITYADAMDRYGIDKPDVRFDLRLHDLTETLRDRVEFRVFADAIERGGIVKALPIGDGSTFTRKDLPDRSGDVRRPRRRLGTHRRRRCVVRPGGEGALRRVARGRHGPVGRWAGCIGVVRRRQACGRQRVAGAAARCRRRASGLDRAGRFRLLLGRRLPDV
jgi:aspartyl-tRNA synthetase